MDNNEIFLEFWNSYAWPDFQPPRYRLYYNPDGTPRCYSVQDLPGDYIDITQEDYSRMSHLVRVKQGKLIHLSHLPRRRLYPGDQGTPCDPLDISVVVNASRPHIAWSMKSHED